MMTMSFSQALDAVKAGKRARRNVWDDNQFVFLVPGSTFNVNRKPLLGIFEEGHEVNYHAHIDKVDFDGSIGMWNVPHEDLLADDWLIL